MNQLRPGESLNVKKLVRFIGTLILLVPFLGGFVPVGSAFNSGQAASLVIGQPNFTTGTPTTTQNGLNGPDILGVFDGRGAFWVEDRVNNRVLEFVPPFHDGMPASLVIGQRDFTSSTPTTTQNGLNNPAGVALDSAGDLWVADFLNNRILQFVPPFNNGAAASLVIGQAGFTTSAASTTQTGLNNPAGVVFDSAGNLWVADLSNNRVLKFAPPFSNGMAASLVIGQAGFTTNSAATTQNGLNGPNVVMLDSHGDLWVTDALNNRVIEFLPPFTNGMLASLVIGQATFTTGTAATTQTGLVHATGEAFDSAGDLWVADFLNNRMLEFVPPFSNGMAASLVIGQPDFTSSTPATTQNGLRQPSGVAFDSSGNLWVIDDVNNRILEYAGPPRAFDFSASKVEAAVGGFSAPYGQAYDPANNLLYVANWNAGTVSVVNSTNNIVAAINVGPSSSGVGPVGVAYNPSNNFVYVVNHAPSSSVSVINGTSNSVVTNIPIGAFSYYVLYDPANNNVYATNFGSNTISVISSSNSVIATITMAPNSGPSGIAYDPSNHDLYVTNQFSTNSVSVVDPKTNTIIATIGVGASPTYAAFDPANGKIYVTNQSSNTVSVIDPNTNTVVATVSAGTTADAVAFYPTDSNMYVTNAGSNTVSVIDSKTNTVLQTISVDISPTGVGFYPATDAMYVSNMGSTTVSIISASPNFHGTTLLGGFDAPYGQAYDPANNLLYVANWNVGTVSAINSTNSIVATINVGPASSGVGPVGVAYNPSNNLVYVVNHAFSSSLSVINGTTNTVVATLPIGQTNAYAYYVLYDPANRDVYATNFGQNTISVINSTNSLVATIVMPANSGPSGIAYDPLNHDLYVTSQFSGNSVFVIDPSNAIIATIGVGTSPTFAAFDPANGKVYVTNQQSNTTSVINTSTNTVLATVPVGHTSDAVAFYPTDSNMYVTNAGSNTVSVLDSKTNGVVRTVSVGANPTGVGYYPATDAMYVSNMGSTTVNILIAFAYTLSSSGGITVVQGSSGSNTITAALVSSPTQPATLSVSGLPTGASALFSGGGCTSAPSCLSLLTFSTSLTISTFPTTPAGTYTVAVLAVPNVGLIHSTQFTLVVNTPFDFSISNSGSMSAVQGSFGSNTIIVTLVGGVTQPVALSVSGLPSGATPSFSGTCAGTPSCTASPSFSGPLAISTLSSTTPGSYIITVTGTGGGVTHATQFTLVVTQSTPVGASNVPISILDVLAPYISAVLVMTIVLYSYYAHSRRRQQHPV